MTLMEPVRFSDADLVRLADQASTLIERLSSRPAEPVNPIEDDPIVERRLAHWCQTIAGGDWQKFAQRLDWDGFDLASVRPYLRSDFTAQRTSLPSWVTVLDESVAFAIELHRERARMKPAESYRFLVKDTPLPFEEFLAPFVLWAQQQLAAKVGSAYNLLSGLAHASIEHALLEILSSTSSKALYFDFALERARKRSSLSIFLSLTIADSPDLYAQFVDKLLSGSLLDFFKEYALLGRQIATLLGFWIEMVSEFLLRLEADREEIAAKFNHGQSIGQVSAVKLGLSDRHNHGRAVMIVTFEAGLKLVYKPKGLQLEAIFFDLLDWFNREGLPLPFKTLLVLNRSGYGWVEFAEYLPCRDQAEARRFFQRMGMLACIVYALEGNDYHHENIIAVGEHPILVDMETLFHPYTPNEEERTGNQGAHILAHRQLADSILRTGFLPRWIGDHGGKSFDISGLGGFDDQETSYQREEWEHLNTAQMNLKYVHGNIKAQSNLPRLNEHLLNTDDYLDEFVAGFELMYRFFIDHRDALLAGGSPFVLFNGQRVRFLARATRVYALLLKKTRNPDSLRQGIDASIEWDGLSKAYIMAKTRPIGWPILQAEHRALAQLDIPYFTAATDSMTFKLETGETIAGYFDEPSYDHVVALIQNFDSNDLEKQIGFIRESFYSRAAREMASVSGGNRMPAIPSPTLLNPAEFVQQAIEIAEGIRHHAIRSSDGSATWIALEYDMRIERFQLQPLGYSLYGGTPGIGLFLAALEKYCGGAGFRDLALGAVQNIRRMLHEDKAWVIGNLLIGGMAGIGSIAYTLLHMSDFLADHALLDDACLTASLITSEKIAADQNLDIVAGSAGAILALLALYERTHTEEFLQKARECGYHLLDTRRVAQTGYRAWPSFNGKLLTGFSHGAAGIAYALLQLYAATRESHFLDAAGEGINYEQSLFVPEQRNWPDLRQARGEGATPVCITSWCHGAPGIGMARLAGLPILDSRQIRQEVEVALETTQHYGVQGVDHLCCGTCGRSDILLEAGRRLSRPELINLAYQWMTTIVERAKQHNGFHLFLNLPVGLYSPGLFQGMAGIGYELLRLADDQGIIPSVLLLQDRPSGSNGNRTERYPAIIDYQQT